MLTAVIAAIEAGAVALAGIVAVGLPALLLWLVEFGLGTDPSVVLGGTVSVWLLAHLVPLEFGIGAESALSMGLAAEPLTIPVSLAPLGLTALTVLLAVRAGLRFAREGGTGVAGVVGGALGFAAVSAALGGVAFGVEQVPFWVIVVVPGALYGASALVAFLVRAIATPQPWWMRALRAAQQGIARIGIPGSDAIPERGVEVLRLALAGLAGLIVLSSLGIVVSITAGYVEVTALTQGLQLDLAGAVVMFLVQLMYLPVLLIWGVSWFSGAGFSLGEGTLVSPFDTLVGPLPAVPILGALPQGWGPAALLAPMLVVVLGIGIGVLSSRLSGLRGAPWSVVIAVPVIASLLIGLVIAGAVMLASGSLGPDRLSVAGADAWKVGGLIAAELGVGLLVGAVVGRIDAERIRSTVPAVATRVRDASRDRVSTGIAASGAGMEALARRVRESRSGARGRAPEPDSEEERYPVVVNQDTAEHERAAHDEQSGLDEEHVEIDASVRADAAEATDDGTEAADDGADAHTSPEGSTSEDTVPNDLPPLDVSADSQLTPEEEEALLRAFSWDGDAPPKSE